MSVTVRSMDFRSAWHELQQYEKVNELPSDEFYAAYHAGDVEVSPVSMRWVAIYEIFRELAPATTDDDRDRRLISA